MVNGQCMDMGKFKIFHVWILQKCTKKRSHINKKNSNKKKKEENS